MGKNISIIAIMMLIAACNQPYSQPPSVTNTPMNPDSLFATSIGQLPDITMSDVANFATGTGPALTGTPLTVATPTSTLAAAATPSPIPVLATGHLSGVDVYALEATAIHNTPIASYQYIVPVTLKLNESF